MSTLTTISHDSPRIDRPSRGEPSAGPNKPGGEGRSPCFRILAVDDKAENLRMIGSLLETLECQVVTATDGKSALQQMTATPPDLVLLDVLMPEMDGCEVCRRVRQNPEWSGLPIIFLSALDDRELVVRALESGGVDYITKPFNRAELLSKVRTHLALKAARDQLRRLAEDKDELLGILAHGVKSQLSGMSMSAQMLRQPRIRADAEKGAQLADNLADSADRLLAFVKEFLANSAAECRDSLRSETVSVSGLAGNVAARHREIAQRKKLQIETSLSLDPALVRADSSALEQIMDNLLSNALKFSPPGKRVAVVVKPSRSHIEWSVRDEGPGFTDEDKRRMFTRYGRLSARPTGGEPSTGLGLSIVAKLAKAIGGELILESEPGHGATFTLKLPRQRE